MVENERAKLSVLDSDKFLNKVKELVGNEKENPLFTSKEAQDFLNIVEGFHKLYKNDASIAKNFTQTTAQKMGTSIATSAEGAIKQKVIKGAFDPIFRLLPEKIFFGMFSKQIQGGALRYHLKKALSRSLNYNDFKLKLEKELQKTHFNSKTKELLNDLMDNLDQFNKTKEEVLNAKALKEQEARDAELALIREQKEKQEEFFKQKEEEFGQEAINNNALKQGEAIEIQGLGNENSHLNASTEPSLQQPLKNTEKIYLKENDEPLNVEYAVVKKDQVKPTFEHGGPQGRTEKQEALINKITNDFNPDLLVSIKGDLKKGNPIILKDGQVLAGNHRSEAIKNLNGEQLERYKKAVKDNFNIDLKDDEMLVRLVKDNDDAKIKRYAFASNEGMENNLSEQSLVLFSKYKNEIDKLKKSDMKFNADDLYNEKNMVMKALGENSLTKLEDTNKALFYSLLRGANANVVKALEELEKQNLEELSKTLSMFYDNAGGFFNITHDTDMPLMSNLQNYLSDAFVKTARKTESRESDFSKLSEDIKAFLNNADKETALKLNPNLVNDLKSQALGVGFARFSRLENPNTNLFDFLKDLKKTFEEKGQPDLFSGKEGTPLNKRNEYDFIEELLLQGQDSKAKFDLINQIRELRDWQNDPAHFKPKEEEIKTTREIINQAKANGLSVKETRKAVEANKALKEEKLKQEIKEAKEKHNALKESENLNSQMIEKNKEEERTKTQSENSHLKEEEIKTANKISSESEAKENKNKERQMQEIKEVKDLDKTMKNLSMDIVNAINNHIETKDAKVSNKELEKAYKDRVIFYEDLFQNLKGKFGKDLDQVLEKMIGNNDISKKHLLTAIARYANKDLKHEYAGGLRAEDKKNGSYDFLKRRYEGRELNQEYFNDLKHEINMLRSLYEGKGESEHRSELFKREFILPFEKEAHNYWEFYKEMLNKAHNNEKSEARKIIELRKELIEKSDDLYNKFKKAKSEKVKEELRKKHETLIKEGVEELEEAYLKLPFQSLEVEGSGLEAEGRAIANNDFKYNKIKEDYQREQNGFDNQALNISSHNLIKKELAREVKKEFGLDLDTNQHLGKMAEEYEKIYNEKNKELLKNFKENEEEAFKNWAKNATYEELEQAERYLKRNTFLTKYDHENIQKEIITLAKDRVPYKLWNEILTAEESKKWGLIYPFANKREALKRTEQPLNEKSYELTENQRRLNLEKRLNIQPLKEFGLNFTEFYHDGENAIKKLMNEKHGQVAGAFNREDLGDIDLVWGNNKYGLKHILERREEDFLKQGLDKEKAEYEAQRLIEKIPSIIKEGKIYSDNQNKIELITNKHTLVLGKKEDNQFIITELQDR